MGSCVEGCKNIWSSTVGEQTMLKSYINTGGGGGLCCGHDLQKHAQSPSRAGITSGSTSSSFFRQYHDFECLYTSVHMCTLYILHTGRYSITSFILFYTFTQTNKLCYNSQGRGHYNLLLLGLSLYGDGGNCFMVAWQHPMGARLCRKWIELGVKGHTTFCASHYMRSLQFPDITHQVPTIHIHEWPGDQ